MHARHSDMLTDIYNIALQNDQLKELKKGKRDHVIGTVLYRFRNNDLGEVFREAFRMEETDSPTTLGIRKEDLKYLKRLGKPGNKGVPAIKTDGLF